MSAPYPERLYYADPYLTQFEARVVERLRWEDLPAVVLDRTAFYPASGGQPSDQGSLCDVPVVDVDLRDSDGAVIHLLGEDLAGDRVTGVVDWDRRFDHMQQHTGQHLLSAACERLLDADTISFHLGSEACTIDLNVARIQLEAMEPVEDLVNRVIWDDRRVTARFVDSAELTSLSLRRPPHVEGPVRLIEVVDFDLNPCGGTHVARTGEIGLLKILRIEYRGDESRIEFLCGRRALEDYRLKNQTVLGLSAELTVGYWELEGAVARLEESLKEARRELRAAREQMLEQEAERLARDAVASGGRRIVHAVWEGRDPADIRALAQKVAESPDAVVVLASLEGNRTHLCVARSEGVNLDAEVMLQAVFEPLGGKGGGQPHFAQGSAPLADRAQVEEVLKEVVAG
ncbi:MAG: DHHA1 domain-containing protein [Anaerolineae bacterium]